MMLVGKISGTSSISCSLSGSSSLAGKLLLGSTIPVYRGETSFIPSDEAQTITIAGMHTADGVRTAGTASGGGSSWELISSTTMTVSTTSTSAQSAGTVALGSAAATKDAVIWVHVRDTEGKRAGYFYGSDAIFVNANKANSSTTAFTGAGVTTLRCTSSGTYAGYTGAYGVYGYSIASNGTLTVRKRYNSSYSLTVNSDYKVDVYKLVPPSGMVLFE